jgi:hypothetical protein
MPAQEIVDSPSICPTDDGSSPSEEKMALADFAFRLGACNVTAESGIAEEEGNTRKEARLLMSLLASPLKLDEYDVDPISSSESERSLASDSSCSRRDTFTFTCPSLSLEISKRIESLSSLDADGAASSLPAALLSRPLKVDDRGALRLSADAMARNLSLTFQRALGWRVQSWISTLSRALEIKKQRLLEDGASSEDLECLLCSPEGCLIGQLRAVADSIKVSAASMKFRVGHLACAKRGSGEPATKKRRLEDEDQASDLEEGDYLYKVSHGLMMDCTMSLATPAGFSEVTMEVPGVIAGTFLSTETGMEELRSVSIELDTGILAAMVEKSCRTVVRASVESFSQPPIQEPKAYAQGEVPHTSLTTASPLPYHPSSIASNADFRGTMVTPRSFLSDEQHSSTSSMLSPQPMLFSIPDDLEDAYTRGPRRISPHSHLSAAGMTHHLAPRTPSASEFYHNYPSLVSPPPNEASIHYRDVPDNGPSLPILVEAASRVLFK